MTAPDSIHWPGVGDVPRLQPRGMSDYQRGAGCAGVAQYRLPSGDSVWVRDGRWQAQSGGNTTRWHDSADAAIRALLTCLEAP